LRAELQPASDNVSSTDGPTDEDSSDDASDRRQDSDAIDRLDSALQRLERSIAVQLSPSQWGEAPNALDVFRRLSPQARALLRELAVGTRSHLTRQEYRRLAVSPVGDALAELRATGLLAPLAGENDSGAREVVYWIPGPRIELVGAGLMLAPPEPPGVTRQVHQVLERVGFFKRAREWREAHQGQES